MKKLIIRLKAIVIAMLVYSCSTTKSNEYKALNGVWHFPDSLNKTSKSFNSLTFYRIDKSNYVIGQSKGNFSIGRYMLKKYSPYSLILYINWADKNKPQMSRLFFVDDSLLYQSYFKIRKGKLEKSTDKFIKKFEINLAQNP